MFTETRRIASVEIAKTIQLPLPTARKMIPIFTAGVAVGDSPAIDCPRTPANPRDRFSSAGFSSAVVRLLMACAELRTKGCRVKCPK